MFRMILFQIIYLFFPRALNMMFLILLKSILLKKKNTLIILLVFCLYQIGERSIKRKSIIVFYIVRVF